MKNKTKLQLSSLFMIVLMLALPVAFAQNMTNLTAGNETAAVAEELSLEVVAPLFSKDKYITIEGTTAPNARLEYYIGPTKIKVSRAKSDGTFTTTRIPLIKKGDNDLLIKASIEDKAAQKIFTIHYDPVPPYLNLSKIPEFTIQTALQVHGDVTEPVTIKYTSYPKKDEIPPDQVSGLEMREIKKNQVTMVWIPSDAQDLLEYTIYRNDKRVGVARSAIYVDNDVASGKEYTYRIAAVDTSCNECVKSAPKKAVTPPGGSDEEKAVIVPLSCAPTYQTLETAVPFDITLPLQAGGNIIEIIASDKAGNTAKVKKLVTVDIGPPQFLATNLDAIGTTYIPEVTIMGTVSEKASVFVYINDETKPSHFGLTDDNGGFEIPVKLRRDVEVSAGSATELDTGVGWKNKIKLKAVDLAGQEAWYPGQQQSKEVILAMCGYGAWLDFDVEEVTPGTLTPRLLMQGIQQLGIPFTLRYIGGQDDAQIAGVVNAVPVRISPDLEDAFDNDKISSPQVWIKPRPGQKGVWDGYVQINFVKWPVDQLDLEGNITAAAIEAAISDWRRGEFHEVGATAAGIYLKPGCLNPSMGCVKLYLEIDIPLKEKSRIYDPQTQQERFEWKTVRQRNCLPIILDIDQVIPPDVIRKDALEGTSNFLGNAIDLIDEILDPLYTFTENMVYLCLGSTAALFIMGLIKRFACSKIWLAKGVDMNIAEAGLCEMAYTEVTGSSVGEGGKVKETRKEDDQYKSCKGCQNALRNYRNFLQDVYTPICDRISCPSAPTVQKYILDKRGTLKDITSSIKNKKIPENRQNDIIEKWGVKGSIYSGNSCGFSGLDLISTSYTVSKVKGGEGETCTKDDDCGAGLFCHATKKVCFVMGATEAECKTDDDCELGLACVGGKCTYIQALGGAGDTCTKDAGCSAGLFCHATKKVCFVPSPVEGDCSTIDDCELGLDCVNNKCRYQPSGDVGANCEWDRDCKEGLICFSTTNKCAVPSKAEQPCGVTDDCEQGTGLACHVLYRVCQVPVKEGFSCDYHEDCGYGLTCHPTKERCFNVCFDDPDCTGEYKKCVEGYCMNPFTPTGTISAIDVLSSFATGSAIAGEETKPAPEKKKAGPYAKKICGIDIGKVPLNSADGKIGIKKIYEIYKGDYADLRKKCTDPSFHPACPLCCGYEYMWEWNSACGVGNFLDTASYDKMDLDTFNELKESTRLAAEKVGRGDDVGGGGIFDIFNSMSGFCTPEGNPTPDVISTHLNFHPKIEEAESNLMQVFVFIDPTTGGDQFKYRIYRGYLAKSFVIETAISKGKKFDDVYSFSSTLKAVKEEELTKHFNNLGTKAEAADKKKFISALCKKLGGSGFTGSKKCKTVAPGIFDQVKGHVGTVEQEYIIRPDSSIINSVRCICLTAIIAFLEQWRQIAQAIKNCIDMIILTGDGEEGMCRAMLSNYVCDLLWEIITCFANKWNVPSGKRLTGDIGIGDVLGILTGAGTDISNNVKGRYGETAMFNAMFNEKEIVHGLCYLAFGLEWNLDVSAMVQQSVESVPIETMVLGPLPAQARFIAWNPVTNPRGLTTWEYHFGLMISAGADINKRIKLKCSTGFGCGETDGFVGGECDCNELGTEKVISINPTCTPAWKNRLSKNELVSYDCSYVIQAGKYRFDTLIFEYDWQDPGTKERRTEKSEAAINRVGSAPPVFCRFDTFSLSFRCKFGESPSGIRIEKVEPQYKYSKDNKEVFAMDKSLDFELSIKQIMPEIAEEMDAGIKFLGYKIVNSENKVVKEIDLTDKFTTQLKTDGSYKENVEISFTPEGPSWEPFFGKDVGASGLGYAVVPWSEYTVLLHKIKADPRKYLDGISIKATKDGKSITPDPDKKFVIDIDVKSNTVGLYVAESLQQRGSYIATPNNIVSRGRERVEINKTYTYPYKDVKNKNKKYKDIEYEIKFILKSKESFDRARQIQFLIKYPPGKAVGDPCADPKKPVTWKITFTSYDADKYGRVTDQKSVDSMTGEIQEKTIPFQIVCEKAAKLKKKDAEIPTRAGIFEPPFLFFEKRARVINLVTGVTLPPGEGRLYVETFGKGSVEVEVTEKDAEKDASAKTYPVKTISFTELPQKVRDIKKDIRVAKETGDLFFTTITFEKDKEYTIKITFKSGDKVVDTKTYTVMVSEVPEMQEAYKLRDEKKYTEAFHKFTDVARKYEGTAIGIRAEFEAGITLSMANEYSRALIILDLFVTENPQHEKADDALSFIATIYFVLGQPKEGLKIYQKIIKDYSKGDMVDIAQTQLTIRCDQYKKECQELGITPLPPEKLPLTPEQERACNAFTQFLAETNAKYFVVAESHRELFGDIATLKSVCGIAADVDIKFKCDVIKSCDDYDKENDCVEDVCKKGIKCKWRDLPKPGTCIPVAEEFKPGDIVVYDPFAHVEIGGGIKLKILAVTSERITVKWMSAREDPTKENFEVAGFTAESALEELYPIKIDDYWQLKDKTQVQIKNTLPDTLDNIEVYYAGGPKSGESDTIPTTLLDKPLEGKPDWGFKAGDFAIDSAKEKLKIVAINPDTFEALRLSSTSPNKREVIDKDSLKSFTKLNIGDYWTGIDYPGWVAPTELVQLVKMLDTQIDIVQFKVIKGTKKGSLININTKKLGSIVSDPCPKLTDCSDYAVENTCFHDPCMFTCQWNDILKKCEKGWAG